MAFGGGIRVLWTLFLVLHVNYSGMNLNRANNLPKMIIRETFSVVVNCLGMEIKLMEKKGGINVLDLKNTFIALVKGKTFQFVSQHILTNIHILYTSRLFHCYMMDEFICHFRGVGSILSLLFCFLMENTVSKH